jgi:hypothetical protein
VSEPQPQTSGWRSVGEVAKRMVVGTIAAAVGVGGVAALIAWASGHGVSSTVAAAYYLIGCALFLVGMFPTGGFSIVRGTLTRRRPTGARQEPVFLLGLVLIALGVVADVAHPF